MYKKISIAAAMLALVVAFAIAQHAEPGDHEGRMRGPMQKVMKELNLTEAQQTQMKMLRLELMKKETQLHSRITTLRIETQEAFLADKIDRGSIEKNVKAISAAQEQMKLNMVDHWFAVNSILTPEQQKTWKNVPMQLGEQLKERGKMGSERFRDRDRN